MKCIRTAHCYITPEWRAVTPIQWSQNAVLLPRVSVWKFLLMMLCWQICFECLGNNGDVQLQLPCILACIHADGMLWATRCAYPLAIKSILSKAVSCWVLWRLSEFLLLQPFQADEQGIWNLHTLKCIDTNDAWCPSTEREGNVQSLLNCVDNGIISCIQMSNSLHLCSMKCSQILKTGSTILSPGSWDCRALPPEWDSAVSMWPPWTSESIRRPLVFGKGSGLLMLYDTLLRVKPPQVREGPPVFQKDLQWFSLLAKNQKCSFTLFPWK